MRSSQIIWVSPKSNEKVLVRDKSGEDTEENLYRWRLKLELCSYGLRNAWRRQSCKRQERTLPRAFKGSGPAETLVSDVWRPEL